MLIIEKRNLSSFPEYPFHDLALPVFVDYIVSDNQSIKQLLLSWKTLVKYVDISDEKWCCVFKSALTIVRSKAIDPRKQMVITNTLKGLIRLGRNAIKTNLWCGKDNCFFGAPRVEVNCYGYCSYLYHYQCYFSNTSGVSQMIQS